MIRTLLLASTLLAALASVPTLADQHNGDRDAAYLNDILNQLELSEAKREEVHQVFRDFRRDRQQAEKALSELGKSLPPQEEVRAMRAYSDTVLEARLDEVLEAGKVASVMSAIQAKREEHQEKRKHRDRDHPQGGQSQ
ncbi:hypothetical protein [Marinimicrobium sp. C2-29]|uniref:hypothetical protein n=1 Tax=Marinimicrobium sp. C2-29 TaxID=3139825 RepID=UPI0031397548